MFYSFFLDILQSCTHYPVRPNLHLLFKKTNLKCNAQRCLFCCNSGAFLVSSTQKHVTKLTEKQLVVFWDQSRDTKQQSCSGFAEFYGTLFWKITTFLDSTTVDPTVSKNNKKSEDLAAHRDVHFKKSLCKAAEGSVCMHVGLSTFSPVSRGTCSALV